MNPVKEKKTVKTAKPAKTPRKSKKSEVCEAECKVETKVDSVVNPPKKRGRKPKVEPTKDEKIKVASEELGNLTEMVKKLKLEQEKIMNLDIPEIKELILEELEDLGEEIQEIQDLLLKLSSSV